MSKARGGNVKAKVYKTSKMKKFKTGAPQLIFTKRDGSRFKKTYKTLDARENAKRGWMSAGGSRPAKTTLKR